MHNSEASNQYEEFDFDICQSQTEGTLKTYGIPEVMDIDVDGSFKEFLLPLMKKGTVAVIGLGYVGLPLACLCAEQGRLTYGIDIDKEKNDLLRRGISNIHSTELRRSLASDNFIITSDYRYIRNADIVIICVPTPVYKNHHPNFRALKSACNVVRQNLRKDQLVIIESTVNPGACEEIVQPILEKSSLKSGIDFDIAHCPERIDPGNEFWPIKNIPRVLGATTPKGLERAISFYRSILNAEVIPLKSIKEAEAAKIVENTFRDINIAFTNELAQSFKVLGIDLISIINAAATKPFAFLPHYPGCGVGGHCIPVDPYYLIKHAKKNGFDHKLLKLARKINESMPCYTVKLLASALDEVDLSLKQAKIGIMGLSYKPNIADTRESPAYEIIKILKKAGAILNIYDPFVIKESTVNSLDELLQSSDVLVLTTAHQEFVAIELDQYLLHGIQVIIDGRDCLDKVKLEQAGIIYKGIGR